MPFPSFGGGAGRLPVSPRRRPAGPAAEQYWPQWRGPLATGEAPRAEPPLTWSETNNIKWKTGIPGEGDSTPIVWGDRVFLLTAIPTGTAAAPATNDASNGTLLAPTNIYQFVVLCLDRASGKVLWRRVARQEAPHEGRQENNTYASASPVTDGKLLLAFFGSRGLHCYDFEGNLKWEKDFGKMKTRLAFGEGASPALWGGTVVVNSNEEVGPISSPRSTRRPAGNSGARRATRAWVGPHR